MKVYITPKPPNGHHSSQSCTYPHLGVQQTRACVGQTPEPLPPWGRRDPLATALPPSTLRCSPDRSSGQSTAGAASQGVGPSSKEHARHHLPTGPTVHTSKQASLQNSPPPPDQFQSPLFTLFGTITFVPLAPLETRILTSPRSTEHYGLRQKTGGGLPQPAASCLLHKPPQPGQHLTPALRLMIKFFHSLLITTLYLLFTPFKQRDST